MLTIWYLKKMVSTVLLALQNVDIHLLIGIITKHEKKVVFC